MSVFEEQYLPFCSAGSGGRSPEEKELWRSQPQRGGTRGAARGAWRVSLFRTVLLYSSSGKGRGERICGWSAAMHRLRTTVARLRPLTAAQTAQSLSQPRLLATDRGLRTFKPARRLNTSVAAEPFLNGTSSNYVEEMYYAWLENPRNVHKVLYIFCLVFDVTPALFMLENLNLPSAAMLTHTYAKQSQCYSTQFTMNVISKPVLSLWVPLCFLPEGPEKIKYNFSTVTCPKCSRVKVETDSTDTLCVYLCLFE